MRWQACAILTLLICSAPIAAEPAEPAEETALGAPSPSMRLLTAVREQTERLEEHERSLEAREQAVVSLEAEALRILDKARTIRVQVEARIDEWSAQRGDRVARLARVYSEMPVAKAAPLLEQLGLDLATEVVARMKPKDSAGVLAQMSEPSALRISRLVAKPLTPKPGSAPAKKAPR